ncbi:MAG: copper amine oxidase N-terminal protein [Clostridia bacterium]|nr:copper amine oxidase N-terminal protein [Clostridia bacterium]
MKKFKPYKLLCLTLGVGIVMSGTVLNAASLTKTLKAVYNNIAVSYNGQTKVLSSEPFLINGSVYVPLRTVGEIMGTSVSWANNTVYITGQSSSNVSSEQEIAAKNFEIASLKQQLDLAKKELETYKGTGTAGSNLTTTAINNTLNKIVDTYDEDYDVDWEFDLRLVSSKLELTVSYDSRYDDDDFDDTTESKRKQFIKEICYDISTAHKDVEIYGTLEDSREDTEIAEFSYSKTGSLDYEEESSTSLSDFEDDLERSYRSIKLSDSVSLNIDSIELSERNDTLTFTVTTDLSLEDIEKIDEIDEWDRLSTTHQRRLEEFFDDIINDLEYEYKSYDEIVGVLRDNDNDLIASYEDGDLDLDY